MGKLRCVSMLAAVAFAALCASASASPLNPFQVNLGVGFYGSAAGGCTVQAPAVLKRCTLPPPDRRVGRADEYPTVPGHIVSFRLRLRKPTEYTTAVEVRFRARPESGGIGGRVGPWESLELEGPQLQEFPLAVPFLPGDRVAIDVIVHGDGLGEAASPIASMNAVYERDDKTAPRLEYTYSRHQDFLRTGRVYVKVRSDSEAVLFPECALLTGPVEWALVFHNRRLRAGGWVTFACHVWSRPLQAARKKARRGGHPIVMVHLIAYDPAGNRGAAPKIYIRPG